MSPDPQEGISVFIARQPIFHTDQALWGHELLFRSSGEAQVAAVEDNSQATAHVLADGFALASVPQGSPVLINFPQELLVADAAFALPPEVCVVEVLETVRPEPDVLDALARLKEAGYTLAMDDYAGEKHLAPFLDLVDLVKVDLLALDEDLARIQAVVKDLKSRGLRLLAEKVESEDMFTRCADMGFELFQGFFFSRPELMPGRTIPAGQMSRLTLMRELSNPDLELERLVEIVNGDPGLSYRLFRRINAASSGLRQKVESVQRAAALLGLRQLTRWLQAVVLSDMASTPRTRELCFMALHRARFLSDLCDTTQAKACQGQQAFLLGMFSLLDALLAMPMADVVAQLPLDEGTSCALTSCTGEHSGLLSLVQAAEQGDAEGMDRISAELGMDPVQVGGLYLQTLLEAQSQLAAD